MTYAGLRGPASAPPEIKAKKPPFQYKLYQKCGFLHLSLQGTPSTISVAMPTLQDITEIVISTNAHTTCVIARLLLPRSRICTPEIPTPVSYLLLLLRSTLLPSKPNHPTATKT
eukprot:2899306-Rhodomonas_salina.1